MNKKGFTLVELLATLVIIAIIMGIVLPSASRVSNENKDKVCVAYEDMMVEYAKSSLLNNRYYIELSELEELSSVMKDCDGYVTISYEGDKTIYSPHVSCNNGCQSDDYIKLDDVLHARVIPEPGPTCINNLVYNGQVQSIVRSGDGYVLTNDKRKNIGTQNVAADLVDKNVFMWSDGTVDTKVIRNCTINPREITIKANDITFNRGAAIPSFGYTMSGTVTVNGVTENPLTSSVTYIVKNSSNNTVNITSTSPKGTYSIIPQASVSSNYSFKPVNGTLIIDEMLPATCPSFSGYENAYDGNSHTITVGTTSEGTIKYRTATSGTGSEWTTTAPTRKDYGTTTVYIMVDGDSEHLDNDCGSTTIKINKKPVTVTAAAKSMTYGNDAPSYSYSVSGVIGSDTAVSGTATYTIKSGNNTVSDVKKANVGSYTITPSGLTAGTNYSITYASGALTINKRTVTVTAENKSMTYGNSAPSYSYTTSGVISGDTAVSGTATYTIKNGSNTVSDVTKANAGSYTIVPSGLTATSNYTISYANGTLTIGKRTVTVTAANKSMTYGGSAPSYSYTTSGVISGDTAVSGTASYTIKNGSTTVSNVSSAAVGSYTIVPSGLTATSNYTISYANGTLTIGKAGCTLTVSNPATKNPGDVYDISTLVSKAKGTVTYGFKSGGNNTTTKSTFSGSKLTIGAMTASNDNNQYVDITITDAGNGTYNGCTINKTVTVAKKSGYLTIGEKSGSSYNDGKACTTNYPAYTSSALRAMKGCDSYVAIKTKSGNVSCSIANTSAASCSVNNSTNTLTITGKAFIETKITLTAAATTTTKAATLTTNLYAGIWEYSGKIYSDYSDCVSGTGNASDGSMQYGCGRTEGNVGPCNSAIYSYRCTTGTATQPPNTAQGGYCMCQYFRKKN